MIGDQELNLQDVFLKKISSFINESHLDKACKMIKYATEFGNENLLELIIIDLVQSSQWENLKYILKELTNSDFILSIMKSVYTGNLGTDSLEEKERIRIVFELFDLCPSYLPARKLKLQIMNKLSGYSTRDNTLEPLLSAPADQSIFTANIIKTQQEQISMLNKRVSDLLVEVLTRNKGPASATTLFDTLNESKPSLAPRHESPQPQPD